MVDQWLHTSPAGQPCAVLVAPRILAMCLKQISLPAAESCWPWCWCEPCFRATAAKSSQQEPVSNAVGTDEHRGAAGGSCGQLAAGGKGGRKHPQAAAAGTAVPPGDGGLSAAADAALQKMADDREAQGQLAMSLAE